MNLYFNLIRNPRLFEIVFTSSFIRPNAHIWSLLLIQSNVKMEVDHRSKRTSLTTFLSSLISWLVVHPSIRLFRK